MKRDLLNNKQFPNIQDPPDPKHGDLSEEDSEW